MNGDGTAGGKNHWKWAAARVRANVQRCRNWWDLDDVLIITHLPFIRNRFSRICQWQFRMRNHITEQTNQWLCFSLDWQHLVGLSFHNSPAFLWVINPNTQQSGAQKFRHRISVFLSICRSVYMETCLSCGCLLIDKIYCFVCLCVSS